MNLKIETESPGRGVTKIALTGRLDSNTTPQLDDVLSGILGGDSLGVVYDLSNLEYISSAGLRAIFRTKREMEKVGGTAVVLKPQPQVQKVFDIVKALPTQSVFTSWEEVDEYLDKMQKRVLEGDDD